MRKLNKVSPILEEVLHFKLKELMDKDTLAILNTEIILDVSKLPTSEFFRGSNILRRRDVQHIFVQTIMSSLTDVDNTLDSIMGDCWEAFKAFVPLKTLQDIFSGDKLVSNGSKMGYCTDIGVLCSILKECSNHEDQEVLFSPIVDSIRFLGKQMEDKLPSVTKLKRSIESFKLQFSSKFRASRQAAGILYKDFCVSCPSLIISNSVFKKEPTNSVTVMAEANGLSILCKSTGSINEWKHCWNGDKKHSDFRQTLREFCLEEIKQRIDHAQKIFNSSLKKFSQVMQNSEGKSDICLEIEIQKLNRIFEFQNLIKFSSSCTATILFFLKRIFSRMNTLENILQTSLKFLKIAQKDYLLQYDFTTSLPRGTSTQIRLQTFSEHGKDAYIFCNEYKQIPSTADLCSNIVNCKEDYDSVTSDSSYSDEKGWKSVEGNTEYKCRNCVNEELKSLNLIRAY